MNAMNVNLEVFSKPKHKDSNSKIETISGVLNKKSRTVILADGRVLPLNRNYLAMNETSIEVSKQPIWLYREDEYDWYSAYPTGNPHKKIHVRKSDKSWICSSNNKTLTLNEVELIVPTRKLIKCTQVALTPQGTERTSTQFVWETKKNFIRERFDYEKIRYPKKSEQEIAVAHIYENDEIKFYIYLN